MAIHKLRALEYLAAVVEHGGFAAAARRLGVATASVHRLVTALERDLGLPLLDRSATPMRPTPDAARYVERASRLVAELSALDAGLRDRAEAPAGLLAASAQSVVLQFVLAPLLPRFHARFPGIQLDLRDAGTERDLDRLKTDLLLMFGWPPPQDSLLRTLAQMRWLTVASPAFWSRHGLPTHPSELARLPCVLFRTPYGEVIREWIYERGRERVCVPVDGWLTGDFRAVLDAPVLHGQAAARINDLTARDALQDGRLQPVLLDWTGQHSPPLVVLVRKAVARQRRVRVLLDFLAEAVGEWTAQRLPAGLPEVPVARRPDWFRRRVG